jgi:hypothetical protein
MLGGPLRGLPPADVREKTTRYLIASDINRHPIPWRNGRMA